MKIKELHINGRDICCVAVCDTFLSRLRGLIGRKLPNDSFGALALCPCRDIHTFFMSCPIDAVYTQKDGRVIKVQSGIKPWRISSGGKNAYITVEFPAGTVNAFNICENDFLKIK